MPSKKPSPNKAQRRPITKPSTYSGFVERTSRPLYTSRIRRGPLLAPNEKAGGLLGCESALEGTFAAATRFDTRIKRIYAQPVVMDVRTGMTAPNRDELKARLLEEGYSPSDAVLWFVDFELEVVGRLRRVFVEVKPERRAQSVALQMEERREACERIGVDFMLVLDTDFPEPLRTNLRILGRYAGMPVLKETLSRILEALQGDEQRLESLVERSGNGLAELYGLISSGHLDLDLHTQLISPRASVRPSVDAQRHLLKLPE